MNETTKYGLIFAGGVIVGALGAVALTRGKLDVKPLATNLLSAGMGLRDKVLAGVDGVREDIADVMAEAEVKVQEKRAAKEAAANKLGVTVRVLTEDEQKQVGTEGLLVTESTGAARKAGIRQGDIIVNVNGVKITEVDDLAKVLEKNKNLRVLVQRRDGRIFIPVRIK